MLQMWRPLISYCVYDKKSKEYQLQVPDVGGEKSKHHRSNVISIIDKASWNLKTGSKSNGGCR